VDARPEIAQRFKIDKVPTLVVIEDRSVKCRIVDPRGALALRRQLEPWLQKSARADRRPSQTAQPTTR
jgi:hypothetical protein